MRALATGERLMATADPADAVFAALSDGTRRSLYATLGERGEATATDLARELPVTRQAVQKHLGTLAAAGLVATRRSGREVLYRPPRADVGGARLDGRGGRPVGRPAGRARETAGAPPQRVRVGLRPVFGLARVLRR